MNVIYIALGSNVGDSDAFLDDAIERMRHKITALRSAPRYRSKAVGYTEQPDFVNTVLEGRTDMDPHELLRFVKSTEQSVGRIKRFRWGPREIDIDIIFYGDRIVDDTDLHIPHARFAERDFVLRPLADLNPMFVDPLSSKTIAQLYKELPPENKAIYSVS